MLECMINLGPLIEWLMVRILKTGALIIRDVDGILGEREEPFLYSSGWKGPGYIQIKGLVSNMPIIKAANIMLAMLVATKVSNIGGIAGNVTGGMIPGWDISERLYAILGRIIPYVYVRDTRKKGGNKEKVTGLKENPLITIGMLFVVVEELVNFAESIVNSAIELRSLGYKVTYGACILFYDNPVARKALEEAGIEMIYLFTLPQLLEVAERNKTHHPLLIAAYRKFLADPVAWNKQRGFEKLETGGTK